MKKTLLIAIATTMLLTTPQTASAQSWNIFGVPEANLVAQERTYADVVQKLQYDGYLIDDVRRTLLGRIRIVATNQIHQREVVISRTTGEVLSDTAVPLDPDDATPQDGFRLRGKVTFSWNSRG